MAARAQRRRREPGHRLRACAVGRDALHAAGGRSTSPRALTLLDDGAPLPPPDHYEPNDDAGPWAHALPPLPRTIDASLDYWDDNIDVYRVHLSGDSASSRALTPERGRVRFAGLWAPGTERRRRPLDARRAAARRVAERAAAQVRLAFRAPTGGIYYLEAKLVSQTPDPVAVPARARAQ